jgi:hypothetical protein
MPCIAAVADADKCKKVVEAMDNILAAKVAIHTAEGQVSSQALILGHNPEWAHIPGRIRLKQTPWTRAQSGEAVPSESTIAPQFPISFDHSRSPNVHSRIPSDSQSHGDAFYKSDDEEYLGSRLIRAFHQPFGCSNNIVSCVFFLGPRCFHRVSRLIGTFGCSNKS